MSSSNQTGSKKWGDTTSKRGEISRVFVGNTDYKTVTCEDLEEKFSIYGRITGIDININGFSFVQFAEVEDALRAVNGENGTLMKQRKIEVRMFDKSGPSKRKHDASRNRSRSPLPRPPMSSLRFDGPPGSSRFDGPPGSRFDGPPAGSRFDGPPSGSRFDGPPGSRFDGPLGNSRFDGPPGPPHIPPQGFGRGPVAGPGVPHGMPPPPAPGNDIEIIVVNKDQWAYAEMIERRLRQETPIQYIDLLFLHSPQHISMTLNDLFERRTLYAIVVNLVNEEHKSCTLHILHNQTEHRNIPIDEAIPLISRDFISYMDRSDVPRTGLPSKSPDPFGYNSVPPAGIGSGELMPPGGGVVGPRGSSNGTASDAAGGPDKRLPEEIHYLLRTTISEGGVQFLSLPQIDSIIEYFSKERDRLTSQAPRAATGDSQPRNEYQTSESGYQSSTANSGLTNTLLNNPQLKAALNSLLQIGAIGSGSGKDTASVSSDAPSYMSTSATAAGQSASYVSSTYSSPGPRRHPLLGTEVPAPSNSGYSSSIRSSGGSRGYSSSTQRY